MDTKIYKGKECPFCKQEGHLWIHEPEEFCQQIDCLNCGCVMHIDDWVRRPIENALQTKLDQARIIFDGILNSEIEYISDGVIEDILDWLIEPK